MRPAYLARARGCHEARATKPSFLRQTHAHDLRPKVADAARRDAADGEVQVVL